MNIWHDIPKKYIHADDFTAVIEISKGGRNKYEMDKETGFLRLDRVLFTATQYPANYGFIPRTYSEDGDPLDVLVMCQETINPLTIVQCYPIGVILMEDNLSLDEKIIAVPFRDPSLCGYSDISELPTHTFAEIQHFFSVYKELEGTETIVKDVLGAKPARKIIRQCMERYQVHFCGKMK